MSELNRSVGAVDHTESVNAAERSQAESSRNCLLDIMPALLNKDANRSDNGQFNPAVPLSHFEQVGNDVYRSGRPNGEDGIKDLVEKVWGNTKFDPEQAKHTTVIELRGDKNGAGSLDEKEIHWEAQSEKDLGMTNERFGMLTHNYVDHNFIQSVMDYIDQQKADGQRVTMHCYRGTDRTGMISAAYELTHNPDLEKLVKDNPAQAYQAGLKSMSDSGSVPANFPELTKSLKDYINWKHEQMVAPSGSHDLQAASYLSVPRLWAQAV